MWWVLFGLNGYLIQKRLSMFVEFDGIRDGVRKGFSAATNCGFAIAAEKR